MCIRDRLYDESYTAEAKTHPQRLGYVYYQAGIVVLTASLFYQLSGAHGAPDTTGGDGAALGGIDTDNTSSFFGSHLGSGASLVKDNVFPSITGSLSGSSISGTCDGFRNRLVNVSFNNTTELNSTIYFCRANNNEFNYSSIPTYVSTSKIRVKNESTDPPVSYITTIGLYSADKELLAVAKLSEPLKKTPSNELTLRVRLDY